MSAEEEPSSSITDRDVHTEVQQGIESDEDNDGSPLSSDSMEGPVTFRCFSAGVALNSSKHTSTIDLKRMNERRSQAWKGQASLHGGHEGGINAELEEDLAVVKERMHKKAEVAARLQAEKHRAGRGLGAEIRPIPSEIAFHPPSAGPTGKAASGVVTMPPLSSSSFRKEHVVMIRDFKFFPRCLEVEVGKCITWKLEEAMNMAEHCLESTSDQPDLRFNSCVLQV